MRRRDLLARAVAGSFLLAACTNDPTPRRPTGATIQEEPAVRDEALRDAARRNDAPSARRLIAAGADVNATDAHGESAYLLAASDNAPEVLDLALRHGADVNALDSWNGTALIRAAERGHALVVGRLLRAGISKNHVNRIGYQAIHEVVWLGADDTGHLDTTRVLVAGGVELDRSSGEERLTPLQMARERGYRRIEAVLAAARSALPVRDPDAELRSAAAAGDANRVALAVRAGARLETKDDRGRTPLLLAATYERVEVERLLVALGADPQ